MKKNSQPEKFPKVFVNISTKSIKLGQSRFKKRFAYFFLLSGGCIFYANYYKTDLIFTYEKNPYNQWIIQHCHELQKVIFKIIFHFILIYKGVYKPTWYLPNALVQCIYGAKIDATPYMPFERDLLILLDGGQVALGNFNSFHDVLNTYTN